jgi:hypothetical protein
MRFRIPEVLVNTAQFKEFFEKRHEFTGTHPCFEHWPARDLPMPRYYFNIEAAHRFADPSGLAFKNDHDAIERAKVIAVGVSIDKPETDPTRHISVLNEARVEIFKAPVYSKPAS